MKLGQGMNASAVLDGRAIVICGPKKRGANSPSSTWVLLSWEEASRTQSRSNKQTPAARVRSLESLASLPRQRCRQLPNAGDRCVVGDCCLFATARLIRHGASAQAPLYVALAFVFRKVMIAAMIPLV